MCGSRVWPGTWEEIGFHLLPDSDELVTVLHGACSTFNVHDGVRVQVSVDMLVDFAARSIGHVVEQWPADWDRYGAAAGPIRNAKMIAEGRPDCGLAFGLPWKKDPRRTMGKNPGWKMTGTGDMMARMFRAKLPVTWVTHPGAEAVELTKMPGPSC